MVTKKDSDIEVIRDEELPAMSHHIIVVNATAESPSTEIPSSEFTSKREGKEGMAIEKEKIS